MTQLEPLLRDEDSRLRLIERLGFRAVARLSDKELRQVYRVRHGTSDYIVKFWQAPGSGRLPYPVTSHRLLPLMEGPYRRLVLPSYLGDGFDEQAGHHVATNHIAGMDFRDRWHLSRPKTAGGRGLENSTIDLVVDLVRELAEIPTDVLVDAGLKTVARRQVHAELGRRLVPLVRDGLLDEFHVESALGLTADWAGSRPVPGPLFVSNADFRLLNLIEVSEGRTALIDWDDARASDFEREHCIAYQWLFQWNRPDLQAALVWGAHERLDIDRSTIRVLLLTRAAAQAQIYASMPDLRRVQADYVADALDDLTFAGIWS